MIGVMAWAFTTYIMLKGVKHLIKVDFVDGAACRAGRGVAVDRDHPVRLSIARRRRLKTTATA